MSEPNAPHLSNKGRQWFLVEIKDFTKYVRPASQGGLWYLANQIKVLIPVFPDLVKIPRNSLQTWFNSNTLPKVKAN